MLKFKPVSHASNGTITEGDRAITSQANRIYAAQTQAKYGDLKCEQHPDFENEIFVDSHSGNPADTFRIGVTCCEAFRRRLAPIEQNLAPLENQKDDE